MAVTVLHCGVASKQCLTKWKRALRDCASASGWMDGEELWASINKVCSTNPSCDSTNATNLYFTLSLSKVREIVVCRGNHIPPPSSASGSLILQSRGSDGIFNPVRAKKNSNNLPRSLDHSINPSIPSLDHSTPRQINKSFFESSLPLLEGSSSVTDFIDGKARYTISKVAGLKLNCASANHSLKSKSRNVGLLPVDGTLGFRAKGCEVQPHPTKEKSIKYLCHRHRPRVAILPSHPPPEGKEERREGCCARGNPSILQNLCQPRSTLPSDRGGCNCLLSSHNKAFLSINPFLPWD